VGRSSPARLASVLSKPFLCQRNVALRNRNFPRPLGNAVPESLKISDLLLFRELTEPCGFRNRRMFHLFTSTRNHVSFGRRANWRVALEKPASDWAQTPHQQQYKTDNLESQPLRDSSARRALPASEKGKKPKSPAGWTLRYRYECKWLTAEHFGAVWSFSSSDCVYTGRAEDSCVLQPGAAPPRQPDRPASRRSRPGFVFFTFSWFYHSSCTARNRRVRS
jgi:hypothetical protein